MKHCSLSFACFALVVCFAMPVFAAPNKTFQSVETIMLDNFDEPGAFDWNWGVITSRFVDEGFPKYGYVDGMPNSLKEVAEDKGQNAKVLGVQVSFQRKGDNWFEVFPQKENENGEMDSYEVSLKGILTQIDFWVWGSNYLYYLDVLVRDADGRVHSIPAGSLNFQGWRNLVIKIPGWLRQTSSYRSGRESITFVGFHVRSDPGEAVDNFLIYFDNLRYTTNTYSNVYDGFNLRNIDFDALEGGNAQ
ncbi:MAG TPA: flagellar filament outer layer protein FlaA [Treponemataceae bacterium]|nr:flagellar filament outer layer protein FlaA [Treponemataceae bacterium]